MIGFKFHFRKREYIPRLLTRRFPPARKENVKPTIVPNPPDQTENCSLERLNMGLAGYVLVDAFSYESENRKLGEKVYVAQFWFVRNEYDTSTDDFRKIREDLCQNFMEICIGAFWRVKTFVNLFYENGAPVPGQSTISFVMEARRPRYKSDGSPEVQWHKDEKGERLGDVPVPIFPDCYLMLHESGVSFES